MNPLDHANHLLSDRTRAEPADRGPAASSDLAKTLAAETIDALNLHGFVERWNGFGGSVICRWEHLCDATAFEPALVRGLNAAGQIARALGIGEEFECALQAIVTPTVRRTAEKAISTMCGSWAASVASSAAALDTSAGPFRDDADWAEWVLRHVERPPLCGPEGEDLFPRVVEDALLRDALRAQAASAAEAGWIERSGDRRGKVTGRR